MPTDALAMQDEYGNTALNIAALVGNTQAAIILVKKNRSLLHIRHSIGYLPVHRAALNAHKDTLVYLLACHYKDDIDPRSLAGGYGVELLVSVIDSGFFGESYLCHLFGYVFIHACCKFRRINVLHAENLT